MVFQDEPNKANQEEQVLQLRSAEDDQILDIYPLTPMQEGLLFHALYEPSDGLYHQQYVIRCGDCEPQAAADAWLRLMKHHPVMSTTFSWQGLDQPLQLIHSNPSFEIIHQRADGSDFLERHLASDREQGFDLIEGPLTRLAVIRDADTILVWSFHHLLLDGWSTALLLRDLITTFSKPNQAIHTTRPFVDFVDWLQQQSLEEAALFWHSELAGHTRPTPLPLSDNTPAAVSRGRVTVKISSATQSQLQTFRLTGGYTENTIIQAAWAVLLSRLSGSDQVVFGQTVSGRPHALAGSDQMIGLFINTIPVRVIMQPNGSVNDFLNALQQRQALRETHAHPGLVEIQKFCDLPRSLPLFQSLMVYENFPVDLSEDGPVKGLDIHEMSHYPLVLLGTPAKDGFNLALTYDPLAIDPAVVSLLNQGLSRILDQLNRASSLLGLDPFPNPPTTPQITAPFVPIHRQIQRLAEEDAAAPAVMVVGEDKEICVSSRGELHERVMVIAAELELVGVSSQNPIALCLPPGLDLYAAMLAVLHLNATYLPTDPTWPLGRIEFILKDAGVTHMVTYSRLAPKTGVVCICLDHPRKTSPISQQQDRSTNPQQGAYVVYTSGSTGVPKGAWVTHGNLAAHAATMTHHYQLTSADRVLQFTSPAFDVAAEELWPTLCTGGVVVRSIPQIVEMTAFLTDLNISVANIPVSFWHEWVHHLSRHSFKLPNQLRLVICGTERLLPERYFWWLGHVDIPLFHAYGCTETTITSTLFKSRSGPRFHDESTIPMGYPLDRIRILDEELAELPLGCVGQLFITGPGVSRGYVRHPELTAARFIPDPFADTAGARMYKTGDLVRSLPDGNLVFHGRVDLQIKLRGHRIEPAEIETALAAHPRVKEAVVVLRDAISGPYLSAYAAGPSLDEDAVGQLIRHLERRLPDFMMPARLTVLSELPKLPNRKLNRNALPEAAGPRRQAKHVAPRNEMEALCVSIWMRCLGLSKIGVRDDFFMLGGHSLTATRVVAALLDALEINIPIKALFENPTVVRFAAYLTNRLAAGGSTTPGIPTNDRDRAPLSFSQQRLWFMNQMQSAAPAYNISAGLMLTGPLNQAAFQTAVQTMVDRHHILTTVFVRDEDEPAAISRAATDSVVTSHNLAGHTNPLAVAREQAITQAGQAFDLEQGPLLRINLYRISAQQHLLAVCMHHLISDHHSMQLMLMELSYHYRKQAGDAGDSLPQPFQYADFAAWQRDRDRNGDFDKPINYWCDRLAGLSTLPKLPYDRARPKQPSYRGGRVGLDLDESLTARLRAFGAELHLTTFMLLETAFAALLCRYQGHADIAVGTAVTNRNRPELEQSLGFYANTVVLRNDFRDGDPVHGPDFETMAHGVRALVLEGVANSEAPFERIVQALQPERDPGLNPLFQIAFTLYVQDQPPSLPGLKVEPVEIDAGSAKFDLLLALSETPQTISGVLEYSVDLFDRDTIERFSLHFKQLLDQVLSNPELQLNHIPLLSQEERRRHLQMWHGPIRSFAINNDLVTLFQAVADSRPQSEAVCGPGPGPSRAVLSYSSLDQASNRLAHHLIALGVEPGDFVALLLEREIAMVTAVLAVLKAGATYVPLDPMYPSDRMALMIGDAGCGLMITNLASPPEAANGLRLVHLEADRNRIEACSPKRLTRSNPEATAYVIYTSGSTGRPKGVPVSHGGVVRLFSAAAAGFNPSHQDCWSLFHSIAFDFSVWELWGALLHGGRLVVVPFPVSRDPKAFCRLLRDESVTVLNQTPRAFQRLVQEWEGEALPALRLVIFGGEALDHAGLEPWFERMGDEQPQLFNMYGITETIVHVTLRRVHAEDVHDPRSKIGGPLPDLGLFLLDAAKQRVPVGVVGEFHVAGAGLTRGYLNAPRLTAGKFIPLPDDLRVGTDLCGDRLYQTGDLGRLLPDGEFEYLGRADQQIKIRGFRIEIGEIEHALKQQEAVANAVVVHSHQDLTGYLIPHAEHAAATRNLARLEQAGRLPRELQQKMPNGLIVAHANVTETDFLYEEIFVHNAYFHHGIHLDEGACIVDIGAHIGAASLFFADHLKDYRIIAVEPIPTIFDMLQLNAQLYNLKLTALNMGVGRCEGSATFTHYPNVSVISGQYASKAEEREVLKTYLQQTPDIARDVSLDDLLTGRLESQTFECPLTTLSSIIADHQLQRIDLLKIDAEKSEHDVLAGILPADRDKIQQMVIEVHDIDGRLQQIEHMLQAWGFHTTPDQDSALAGTGLYNLYATRNPHSGPAPPGGRIVSQSPAHFMDRVERELRLKTPYYMIPNHFMILDQFPLTAHGKLDRAGLPQPATEPDTPSAPPQTETQHALARIWCEILALDEVGVDTNFFHAGGHSIPATRVLSKIRSLFDITLPPRYMFEEPTIRKLAARIDLILETHRMNQQSESHDEDEEEIEF